MKQYRKQHLFFDRSISLRLQFHLEWNLLLLKNHHFLLKALEKLKGENIELDIYGDGMLRDELALLIKEHDLPVKLMGKVTNLNEVIGDVVEDGEIGPGLENEC